MLVIHTPAEHRQRHRKNRQSASTTVARNFYRPIASRDYRTPSVLKTVTGIPKTWPRRRLQTFVQSDIGLRGCVRVLMLVIHTPAEHRQRHRKNRQSASTTVARNFYRPIASRDYRTPSVLKTVTGIPKTWPRRRLQTADW